MTVKSVNTIIADSPSLTDHRLVLLQLKKKRKLSYKLYQNCHHPDFIIFEKLSTNKFFITIKRKKASISEPVLLLPEFFFSYTSIFT